MPLNIFMQLKRFQFDRTSRRKLNDPIAFPLDDLDIAAYIAKSRTIYSLGKDGCADPVASKDSSATGNTLPSSKMNKKGSNISCRYMHMTHRVKGSRNVDTPAELEQGRAEGQVGVESLSLGDSHISDCTKYDLYSVIHHVGVMVSERVCM